MTLALQVARGMCSRGPKGEAIPEGGRSMRWRHDERKSGSLEPWCRSGAKGTALALMVELPRRACGSHFAAEASTYVDAEGPPFDGPGSQ